MAVGAALFSRSSRSPAPALAELETLEFWERGSYIQPISRTCLTRTPEGTRSEEELVKFDCSNNELMALDVSRCYQLKQLNCSVNQLVELDVKNQTNLTLLDCHHNELTELDVSRNQNLASLTCDGNQLTTLDLSKNNSLSHLSCAENRLASARYFSMYSS